MKKICFYSIATELGGAEKSLLDLVLGLQNRNPQQYSPWVVLPKENGKLVDILRKEKISLDILPMPSDVLKISRSTPFQSLLLAPSSGASVFPYTFRLAKLLRSQKPALIHTTGIKCHFIAAAVQRYAHVPVLWHLRDILAPGVTRSALRFAKKLGDVSVIANSKATLCAFDETSEGEVVYNGLDPKTYLPEPNPGKYRKIWNLPRSVPIIGIVGVLSRWKGQLVFLEMAKKLLERGFDARFVIIGSAIYDTLVDQGYISELHEKVRKLGLENHVHFTGYETKVNEAINGLDVLVHASTAPEPFGRVVIEGMACGVPVVASKAGGVVELIEDGKTGLLYSPGDAIEMTDRIATLLSNAELKQSLVSDARQVFLKKFTLDAHIDKISEIYDRII